MPNNECAQHLATIELALISSSAIAHYRIIRSWANTDDGYLRMRATLSNGDFLEMVEYFVFQQGRIATVDYRHQWMDGDQKILRKRWDCAPDHPHVANFPHHVHIADETTLLPSQPMSIIDLLEILEQDLAS